MTKLSLGKVRSASNVKGKGAEKTEQHNWFKDRYQAVLVQRNLLVVVTLFSLLGVLFSSIAISNLTPLKSVEPFVIQVEDKTGVTQVVDPVKASELTANEAVNRYFIVKYIVAHESYNPNTIADSSNIVRVLSVPGLFFDYREMVSTTNPNSWPTKLMGGTRTVKIKAITFLPSTDPSGTRKTTQARITVTEARGVQETVLNQIVTLTFEYAKLNLTSEERYINPLGFRVVTYTVDEENIR